MRKVSPNGVPRAAVLVSAMGAAIAVVMVLVLVFVTFFYVRETVKVAEIA